MAIHRPAVLVIDSLLSREVADACFQAATAAGVSRVVRYSLGGQGDTALHQEALFAKSGVLASDLQADAMHWIDPFHIDSSSIQLKSLYEAAAGVRRGESLLSGIALPRGYQLATPGAPASRRKLQIAQARLNQADRIAALIDRSRTVEQFSDALRRTLDLTSREDQFRLAWSLVVATADSNRGLRGVTFHEAALDQFATRFGSTSAGRWAALRHDVMRNSVEWKRLRSLLSEASAAVEPIPVAESVAVSPFQVSTNPVRQASAVSPLVVPKPETIDLNRRAKVEEAQVDLYWEFHPLVLFTREAARQRSDQGLLQATGEQSSNLTRLADTEHPWSELLRSNGAHAVHAHHTLSPPRLDGVMEDACWQSSLPQANAPSSLRIAYDDDYLYVAIQFPSDQIGADTLAGKETQGLRDQDLSQIDRLACWIDIDRDLMSAMQLQVSDAGRVHDAIDGQPAWQPTWYPAVRRDARHVTVEMAILRRDLVDLPIAPGESWMMLAKPLKAGQSTSPTIAPDPNDWYRVVFHP